MAHCRKEDLQDVSSLLESIRTIQDLKEKSFGCFYRKSKGVLHFHKTKERRFIHVWQGYEWEEIDLASNPSPRSQAGYLKAIQRALQSIHEAKK